MLGINGVPFPVELSLAIQMAEALVALKRAIPFPRWMIDPTEAELAALDRLF